MTGIDYNGGAKAFRAARTLPPPILDSWRRAVVEWAPPNPRLVLDVGSGTGQFCGPLAAWLGADIIGLEPSAGMREQARRADVSDRAVIVAGRAEAVPLATHSVEMAWLSTVVHQITELPTAVAELARVVRPAGRVLIRGYFCDLGVIGLFGHFPGIERAVATFPSADSIVAVFESGGFAEVTSVDVVENWEADLRVWASGARQLRNIDSMFRPLTDDEFEAGLASVEARAARSAGSEPVPTPLRLIVLETPSGAHR